MPDIFTEDTTLLKTRGTTVVKPVREATPLLISKVIFALLIPIFLYLLVLFTSLEIQSLFSFTEDWSLAFIVFLFCLTVIQAGLILFIVMEWKNHEYYLTDDYVQENRGVFSRVETKHDLKNVRDISVRQGIIGRIFNYGDIVIESTAPNFSETITITGAPEPHQHESFLRQFI